jgi:hypothetical protein
MDSATRLYTYPKLVRFVEKQDPAENYHTGLTPAQRGDLTLHSVSLRALIIQKQQRKGIIRASFVHLRPGGPHDA